MTTSLSTNWRPLEEVAHVGGGRYLGHTRHPRHGEAVYLRSCGLLPLLEAGCWDGGGAVGATWQSKLATDFVEGHPLYLAKFGDLLIVSRGQGLRTGIFVDNDVAMIGPSLTYIRIRERGLSPWFLLAWLSLPAGRIALGRIRTGAHIPFIPIDVLRQMKVPVPSPSVQAATIELVRWHRQSQVNAQQMLAHQGHTVAGAINSLIAGQRPATSIAPGAWEAGIGGSRREWREHVRAVTRLDAFEAEEEPDD